MSLSFQSGSLIAPMVAVPLDEAWAGASSTVAPFSIRANSCEHAFDGFCDYGTDTEPGECRLGTDEADCRGFDPAMQCGADDVVTDSCEHNGDGNCDDGTCMEAPDNVYSGCDEGTDEEDCADCAGHGPEFRDCTGGQRDADSGDSAPLAFDGDVSTSWVGENLGDLVVSFGRPVRISSYAWATAGNEQHDPVKWRLTGSDIKESANWTPLHKTYCPPRVNGTVQVPKRHMWQGPFDVNRIMRELEGPGRERNSRECLHKELEFLDLDGRPPGCGLISMGTGLVCTLLTYLMIPLLWKLLPRRWYLKKFNELDPDGSGFISREEVGLFLENAVFKRPLEPCKCNATEAFATLSHTDVATDRRG